MQPHIGTALVISALNHELLQGNRVTRLKNHQLGDVAHQAQILKGHVGAAVVSGGHAGVGAHQLDVEAGIIGRDKELVKSSSRCKTGKGVGKGDLARGRQSRRHADHVGFGHADVKGPFGECLFERLGPAGPHQIGLQKHDIFVLFGQLHQGLGVNGSHFQHLFSCHFQSPTRPRRSAWRWLLWRPRNRRACCGCSTSLPQRKCLCPLWCPTRSWRDDTLPLEPAR